jgi:SRSO17 transposase
MREMALFPDSGAQDGITEYLAKVGEVLGNKRRQASFAVYARGLLGDGERKSAEPIAARACADPARVAAHHQRLTYFLSESGWSDAPVRRFAARHALAAMTKRERVSVWIVAETAFPKQGTHSVGVQRQSTPGAGKSVNCQIGINLSVVTRSEQVPIDFELYLPKCWADDRVRRSKVHIPDEIGFQTRPELAMRMIRRALADEVPEGVVLVDSAYGDSSAFRRQLRENGLDYAAGVQASTTVWRVGESGQKVGEPVSVAELAQIEKPHFHRVGCSGAGEVTSQSRFASCRVRPVDSVPGGVDDEELWLLMEMTPAQSAPCRFWLLTLPRHATKEQMVHLVEERRRTGRVHEDLKLRLGLDHFEGRTFRGWHHHVTVALACFAFLVAERARRNFFRPRTEADARAAAGAVRTSLPPPPSISDRLATGHFLPPRDLVARSSGVSKAR